MKDEIATLCEKFINDLRAILHPEVARELILQLQASNFDINEAVRLGDGRVLVPGGKRKAKRRVPKHCKHEGCTAPHGGPRNRYLCAEHRQPAAAKVSND